MNNINLKNYYNSNNGNSYNGKELYVIFYIVDTPSTTREQNANKYMRNKIISDIDVLHSTVKNLIDNNIMIHEIINYCGYTITNKVLKNI